MSQRPINLKQTAYPVEIIPETGSPARYAYECINCDAWCTAIVGEEESPLAFCAACLARNTAALWADARESLALLRVQMVAVRALGGSVHVC